jgi:hypothetical protein
VKTPMRSESSVHMGQVSGIRQKSQIEKSEFLRERKPRHRESQNPGGIGTVHMQGQVAKDWAPSEFCSLENRGFL